MPHLVLLGAGHAHVEVLRRLARQPIPGWRITLITRDARTAYSGLLPALIRGEIRAADADIDCTALARAARTTLVIDEAVAIDLHGRHVLTRDSGFCGFDLLSIDVGGSTPMPPGDAVAVKPIGGFWARWQAVEAALPSAARVAVVGTGAGGTELAIALAMRLRGSTSISLIGPTPPLQDAPAAARRAVQRAMRDRGVQAIRGSGRDFAGGLLNLADGAAMAFDAAIWATGVAAPDFLARSGLACGPDGSVLTDAGLRSLSHDFVFAAGDCATLHNSARPRAGVWAVRAGPPLTANLRAAAAGREIRPWRPQSDALVILGLGGGRAVAWRGGFAVAGRAPYLLKAWIDRRWMKRYQNPPG